MTRQTARGERGRLVIGVTATSALHAAVQDRLGRFRACYPDIALTLQEGQSAQLVDALRGAMLDAAFLWTPPADGLSTCDMTSEPLVAAVRRPWRSASAPDRSGLPPSPMRPLSSMAGATGSVSSPPRSPPVTAGFSPAWRGGRAAERRRGDGGSRPRGGAGCPRPADDRPSGVVYLHSPRGRLTTELRLVMPLQPGGEAATKFQKFIETRAYR